MRISCNDNGYDIFELAAVDPKNRVGNIIEGLVAI